MKIALTLVGVITIAIVILVTQNDITEQLKLEKIDNAELQLNIQTRETQVEQLESELREVIDDSERTTEEKEAEIERLRQELQAKHEREALAQASPEPVSEPETVQVAHTKADCSLVYNYNNWNADTAYAVCMAESGGNPNAVNMNDNHGVCRGSYGLMQLACFHTDNPIDPHENLRVANRIYAEQGWQPWGAWSSGAFYRYMP